MHEINRTIEMNQIIDFSVWTGNWPFIHLPCKEPGELKKRLAAQGIVKAFVAPIEAILEYDPMRANRKLLADTSQDEFFSPVPIVDLSYCNWESIVDLALNNSLVRMIKLLPNYHMYELTEDKLEKLVALTSSNGLIISIQVRIEDRRGQYPLMKVNDVDVLAAAKVISHFPQQTFLFNNLYMSEVDYLLHALDHVYVDIASLETQNVLSKLYKRYNPDKFLFASHSAFYYPEGNVYKLRYSDLARDEMEQIAYGNGTRLLRDRN